jgi:hypothetical protein
MTSLATEGNKNEVTTQSTSDYLLEKLEEICKKISDSVETVLHSVYDEKHDIPYIDVTRITSGMEYVSEEFKNLIQEFVKTVKAMMQDTGIIFVEEFRQIFKLGYGVEVVDKRDKQHKLRFINANQDWSAEFA